MRAFTTDSFPLPLPDGHRFPAVKYAPLRERAAAQVWGGGVRPPGRGYGGDPLRHRARGGGGGR